MSVYIYGIVGDGLEIISENPLLNSYQLMKVRRPAPDFIANNNGEWVEAISIAFFESEKAIALNIEEDYHLGLADISDVEMREVKEYIRAINPTAATRSIPTRPHIMTLYDPLN